MTVPATPADIIAVAVVHLWQGYDGLGSDIIEEEGLGIAEAVLAALTEAGYTIVRTDDLADYLRTVTEARALIDSGDRPLPADVVIRRLREALGD